VLFSRKPCIFWLHNIFCGIRKGHRQTHALAPCAGLMPSKRLMLLRYVGSELSCVERLLATVVDILFPLWPLFEILGALRVLALHNSLVCIGQVTLLCRKVALPCVSSWQLVWTKAVYQKVNSYNKKYQSTIEKNSVCNYAYAGLLLYRGCMLEWWRGH
jgi:hypothetical protein